MADAAELQKRLDAVKRRAGDIKAIYTLWAAGDDRRPMEKIMDEIEAITFSICCYADGVPGVYLPKPETAS